MDDLTLADAPVDRRAFLLGGVGAAAGAGLASALGPAAGLADRRGGDHQLKLVPIPEPIPGGLPIGAPVPYDFIHVFLPGPTDVTLPFSGLPLQGLDVEPSTITNFKGKTALAFILGSARGSDGVEYGLEVDVRAFEGKYVDADGSTNRGAFALI